MADGRLRVLPRASPGWEIWKKIHMSRSPSDDDVLAIVLLLSSHRRSSLRGLRRPFLRRVALLVIDPKAKRFGGRGRRYLFACMSIQQSPINGINANTFTQSIIVDSIHFSTDPCCYLLLLSLHLLIYQ